MTCPYSTCLHTTRSSGGRFKSLRVNLGPDRAQRTAHLGAHHLWHTPGGERAPRPSTSFKRGAGLSGTVESGTGMWQVGEHVRNWKLVEFLGKGAYGQVFRAQWAITRRAPPKGIPRDVALKFVEAASAARRRQILAEAQTGQSIRHPNLLRTFDVFDAPGHVVLVLELGECSLAQRLTVDGPLPTPLGRRLMFNVAEGLVSLHRDGRMHN